MNWSTSNGKGEGTSDERVPQYAHHINFAARLGIDNNNNMVMSGKKRGGRYVVRTKLNET